MFIQVVESQRECSIREPRLEARSPARECSGRGGEAALIWSRMSFPSTDAFWASPSGPGLSSPALVLRGLRSQAGGQRMSVDAPGALAAWPSRSRGSQKQGTPICLQKLHSWFKTLKSLCLVCALQMFSFPFERDFSVCYI